MKTQILYITMLLAFASTVSAQDEPHAINPKDMIDKVDRSDIQADEDDTEIDGMVPAFEIPKIEFDNTVTADEVVEDEIPEPSASEVAKEEGNASKKSRVLVSNRAIKVSQLKNKDKIVINKGTTYVYRLVKNNIIQYKLKEDLNLTANGLRTESENTYYVTDKDALLGKTAAVKQTVASTVKEESAVAEVTSDVMTQRQSIEKKFNSGNKITREINLKGLQINDDVYIFGDVQLVTRRIPNLAGIRKYWLIEKLDINNSSVKEVSKNKYNIYKRYK